MSLAKKLLIKPGMRVGVVNAPPEYLDLVGELPPGAEWVNDPGPGSLDVVLVFATTLADMDSFAPQAISAVKYDGPFWIAYPKKTSKIKTDLDRDTGRARMSTLGYEGVSLVAMNETWSAMRYRPAEQVGK